MSDPASGESRPVLSRRLGIALILLLVVGYFAALSRFVVNIPYLDDHTQIYDFLDDLEDIDSFADRVDLVINYQSNEHRMATMRLLLIGLDRLFGHVDLRHVILAGNLALPLLFLVLYRSMPIPRSQKPVYLLPLAALLFVPLHQVSNWALVAMTYVCYLGSLASLFFLERSKKRILYLPVSIALAVLAIYTFGGGVFVVFAGVVVLLLPRPSWSRLAIWSFAGALTLLVYFHDLQLPEHRLPLLDNLSGHYVAIGRYFFLFLVSALRGFLAFPQAQISLGLLTAGALVVVLVRQRRELQRSPLVLSYLAFALLLALGTSIARANVYPSSPNVDRFQFMPALILGTLYLLALSRFAASVRRHIGLILTCSLLLYGTRLGYNLEEMRKHRATMRHELLLFHSGAQPGESRNTGGSVGMGNHLRRAIAAGHYRSPVSQLWPTPPTTSPALPRSSAPLAWRISHFRESDEWIAVAGFAALEGAKRLRPEKYVVLTSAPGGQRFFYQANVGPGYRLHKVFPDLSPKKLYDVPTAGFDLALEKAQLGIPAGDYRLGLLVVARKGVGAFVETDLMIHVTAKGPADDPRRPT